MHHAVADCLGAEIIFADGLQHPAKGRVHNAQHQQEEDQAGAKDQIVFEQLAIGFDAEDLSVCEFEGGAKGAGDFEGEPIFAAGEAGELADQNRHGGGHGQGDHGKEDGAHTQGKQPDDQRQRGGDGCAAQCADQQAVKAAPQMGGGQRHAIGAQPEEHGVGKADNAAIAQQQIIRGHQHNEDTDARRRIHRAHARKQERGQRQTDQDHDQQGGEQRRAGGVAGEQGLEHHYFAFTTGIMPIGRHIRMATMRAMLEISAALGSRKAT